MTPPSIAQFKSQFVRDFPYGSTSDTVTDADIANAITEAAFYVNESFFDTESNFQFAYNFVVAHCLVTNLRNSSQGVAGAFAFLENSKSVGSVSQGFSIPDSILNNPAYMFMTKTTYGAKYLSIVYPLAIGQVNAVGGATLA